MEKEIVLARAIAQAVARQGGRVYYVGGFVRDRLLCLPGQDVDIEIHGLPEPALEAILDRLGTRLSMGKSFGIYSLKGTRLDISLPRAGGQPDPFVSPAEAARRRDFTVNALMEDVLTGEVLDFFGGRQDLADHILRHTDGDSFREDPLRVFRAARFSARYGFSIAPETAALCRSLDLSSIPRERVLEELKRALLQSPRPSLFFMALRDLDQLEGWFPQLKALIGVPQPPKFHGEGDVWNHTMLVLDAAAPLAQYAENPFGFLLAALCHDFGKALCTREMGGVLHAYGHETLGLPLVRAFLGKLTNQQNLIRYVENLTALHMRPNALAAQNSGLKATHKLFDQALDPKALLCLAAADDLGRITEAPHISREDYFRQRLLAYESLMAQPQVTGEDLIRAGIAPGPDFSDCLQYAHKLHLSGVSKDAALAQTLQYAKSRR